MSIKVHLAKYIDNSVRFRIAVIATILFIVSLEPVYGYYFRWEKWLDFDYELDELSFYLGLAPILFWGSIWVSHGAIKQEETEKNSLPQIVISTKKEHPMTVNFLHSTATRIEKICKNSTVSIELSGQLFAYAMLLITIKENGVNQEVLKKELMRAMQQIRDNNVRHEKIAMQHVAQKQGIDLTGYIEDNLDSHMKATNDFIWSLTCKRIVEIEEAIDKVLLSYSGSSRDFLPILNVLVQSSLDKGGDSPPYCNHEKEEAVAFFFNLVKDELPKAQHTMIQIRASLAT